ncbi:glutathione-dependent formaldehyde dehydrogenase [Ornithinimicrobium ciconiae]|uniref:Glutathione-dependent formaldehyde dehydrogenase n=1 Tax=Ornithinimicrobium ciconiae TaxID=2594265 RepID=A0A516GCZ4_9MICO|nr:zinc-dependent alcohol dehydrogenase [Ornithinimicrobium ciconiae]QDO89395.1 glutathione-dependent formaldehyde dehydrogenase [Ornithinimicrobium ciconiae]
MRALTWQGLQDVSVQDVPDPAIEKPTDAVVRVTSTAICGSDLHLYNVLAAYLEPGDVLGHEFMGIVEEVGPGLEHLSVGDRVVVPFTICCGSCFMCTRQLYSQCETTQNRDTGKGASLFGYTSLYGSVPGGQAELVRVPHADFGPVKITSDLPDERFLYLSDILPTAWQAVVYADVEEGGTLAVLGLGPVGQLCVRVARQMGVQRVIGVDRVPERLELARRHGAEVVDQSQVKDVAATLHEMTDGRGPDSVVDAVGMEAHGSPVLGAAVAAVKRLPKPLARKAIETAGVDRLAALHTAIEAVRRGGTISVSGVYGGMADPMPMMQLFDKQVQLRMGQCNVRRWTDELYDLVSGTADIFDLEDLATHRVPLEQAPEMYQTFNDKADGCLKVILSP